MAKRGNGRQKVVMQRMPKESARQVTFSKRRSGLMKKGSELCTLCGAQVLIVVFSPGGKVFSFGHPSTSSLIRRFMNEEPDISNETQEILQVHRNSKQSNLNFHLTQLEGLLDIERRKGNAIDETRRETEGKVWWERPIESFTLEEKEMFMDLLVKYRDVVKEEALSVSAQRDQSQGVQALATGNGLYTGLMFDAIGQGPASGFSGGQPLLNPMMVGFNGSVAYDPMAAGSSSAAQMLNGMVAGSSSAAQMLNGMVAGSSSAAQMLNGNVAFGSMAGGSSIDPNAYIPNASGSFGQTHPGPSEFYSEHDLMTAGAGANGAAQFNQMPTGSFEDWLAYNPGLPLGFQENAPVDQNAPGSSNGGFGAFFDSRESDYDQKLHGSNQAYGHGFY